MAATHFPSVEEFKGVLRTDNLEGIVTDHVFAGAPYVFRHRPEAVRTLRTHLSGSLGLAKEENVVIVGSAKIGFSLSPHSFPRAFSKRSDIDVLVVDCDLFDRVWTTMLRWNYPSRSNLSGSDWEWSKRRRNELYWGWFVPSEIKFSGLSLPGVLKPLRDISTQWFNAFQSLSLHDAFADRTVSGRLYRSWEHALLYHVEGLRQIREFVVSR
jgi:hypothetical protein